MARLVWFALAIVLWPCLSEGAKILVVFPFPSRSHNNLGEGFVRTLLKAGHQITKVTPYPKKDPVPNLRYIDVSGNEKAFLSSDDIKIDLKAIINKEEPSMLLGLVKGILKEEGGFSALIKSTFASDDMQKLLNDPTEKFDLIIIEWMFMDMFAGLSAVFECPYIWVSSVNPHWLVLQLIDEIPNPAYNADVISNNIPPFSFFERVQELLSQIVWSFFRIFMTRAEKQHYYDIFNPIMAKKGKQMPAFEDVIYNASLMFGNSHESLGGSKRLPQNFKSVGGYHIDPEVNPLPKDLKKIMENAKDGVIYFSMGSNVRSQDFPEEIKRSLLKMFSSLKYTIIWKFEEDLPNLPKNVHILKWAPQPSILAHPNCKLFITHGGLLSTTETVHFGVPIIGMPIFADQFSNVDKAVKIGFALRVDLSYQMADDLKIAIEEILGNPKYKQKMEELNLIYHDRPVPPTTEIVHWVNHVIRTNGAQHLRSVALRMPWYQKLYLDFLALVLVVIFVVVKALKFICGSNKKEVDMFEEKKKLT